MLYVSLVTFISFISFTKVHLLISCTKAQLIHLVIHFYLVNFTDQIPSHSHSPCLVLVILNFWFCSYCIAHAVFYFFNQSRLWKLGVSSDNFFSEIYTVSLEAELRWYCYSSLLHKNHKIVL